MFKILDKFGGEVSANEQAIFNKISTNNSSGYVNGYLNSLGISKLTSNAIGIDSGLLSIQGFRFVNDTLQTYTVSVTPSQPIPFQLVAVFSHYVSSENDTLEIITRPTRSLRQENLYGGSNAVYELELARFTMTADGITDFVVTLEQLTYNDQDFTAVLEQVATAETNSAAALEAATTAEKTAAAARSTANEASDTASNAASVAEQASADVAELSEQIGEKQGTTVTIGGVAQGRVALESASVGNAEKLGNKAASEYALMTIKTAAEWESENPVLDAGELGYDSTFNKIKVGDGSTAWKALASLVNSRFTFGTAAWGDIAQISKNGEAKKYFNVGDEKTIELSTGEVITVVILGFDHDDLSDGSGKAGMTIGMKNLLATKYRMNATGTNAGGWDESEMRTSTMVTLLSQLPSDLQGVIKQVNKKATAGSKSTSITTSVDKLWLFARVEVGDTIWSEEVDEGEQYEYWKTVKDGKVTADTIKYLSNGSGEADTWWTRTPTIGNPYSFGAFAPYDSDSFLADGDTGVSFGFCV